MLQHRLTQGAAAMQAAPTGLAGHPPAPQARTPSPAAAAGSSGGAASPAAAAEAAAAAAAAPELLTPLTPLGREDALHVVRDQAGEREREGERKRERK